MLCVFVWFCGFWRRWVAQAHVGQFNWLFTVYHTNSLIHPNVLFSTVRAPHLNEIPIHIYTQNAFESVSLSSPSSITCLTLNPVNHIVDFRRYEMVFMRVNCRCRCCKFRRTSRLHFRSCTLKNVRSFVPLHLQTQSQRVRIVCSNCVKLVNKIIKQIKTKQSFDRF